MSCYTRHLADLMPAGPRPDARRRLDQAVRAAVGMPDADCPDVWKAVKAERDGDGAGFAGRVLAAIGWGKA